MRDAALTQRICLRAAIPSWPEGAQLTELTEQRSRLLYFAVRNPGTGWRLAIPCRRSRPGPEKWSRDTSLGVSAGKTKMTKCSLLVLVLLAEAGFAGVPIVANGQAPEGAKISVATHATISPKAAPAGQDLQRRAPLKPSEPDQSTPAALSPWLSLPPQATAPPLAGMFLTRALQRELKRVGCYHGEINGEWTSSTRGAMQAFMDVVNAKLPVAEPNQVLLALMQSGLDRGCNESCHQHRGGQNGCLGRGVTAKAFPNNKTAATIAAPVNPPLKPPMALAGPKAAAAHSGHAARPKPAPRRRIAGSQNRSADSSSRDEHWTVKLWKNSTY